MGEAVGWSGSVGAGMGGAAGWKQGVVALTDTRRTRERRARRSMRMASLSNLSILKSLPVDMRVWTGGWKQEGGNRRVGTGRWEMGV
jgi:hypothetical protein